MALESTDFFVIKTNLYFQTRNFFNILLEDCKQMDVNDLKLLSPENATFLKLQEVAEIWNHLENRLSLDFLKQYYNQPSIDPLSQFDQKQVRKLSIYPSIHPSILYVICH